MNAPCSRRGFVVGGLALLALGPAAFTFTRRLDTAPAEELLSLRGETLRIHGTSASIDALVVDAREGRRTGPYRQFSLLLESDGVLPQDVHRVETSDGDTTDLLVVPIVHPADDPDGHGQRHGAFAYEITFTRDTRA